MNIDETLVERGNVHGNFTDNSNVSQEIKWEMQKSPNWGELPNYQKEALHMIAHKIGRILAGDNNHHDHWHDMIGYARLVERELEDAVPGTIDLRQYVPGFTTSGVGPTAGPQPDHTGKPDAGPN